MKSPDDLLGRRLAWTHRVVHGVLDARMREEGADFTTWKVLAHLTDGEHPSQRELAARILIDPATLVPHLDRLEADGLVERARDERDRRVVRVLLTTAGTSMHAALHRVADAHAAAPRALPPPDGQGGGRTVRAGGPGPFDRRRAMTNVSTDVTTTAARGTDGRAEVIRTEQLTKVYPGGLKAVDGIDLVVYQGEIFGLLGPNGAGKTTTTGMLTTTVIPTSGRAWVGGIDVIEHPALAKQVIGVVPQTNTLD